MVSFGFLNKSNAPTEKARQSIPTDLHCPATVVMKPKSKGAGIMVSDFIDEKMVICV